MQKAKPIKETFLCEYKVSVTTGNCNGASTDAPILLKLYGTRGYTPLIPLVQSETHRVPFLKDHTDVFIVQTYHVGYLVGITIGHDQRDKRELTHPRLFLCSRTSAIVFRSWLVLERRRDC